MVSRKKDTPKPPDEHKKNVWFKMSPESIEAAYELSGGYVDFLNQVKTEREAVDYIRQAAAGKGFKELEAVKKWAPGSRIIIHRRGKYCALVTAGRRDLREGFNILASHADAPRLDLKACPVYEADGLGLLKTHYYGGIKKYQWLAIPMALHGVVAKKDGRVLQVVLGERDDEPAFVISDLLPHLAAEQMEKKMREAVKGESLNILAGSRPSGTGKDAVKKQLLDLLKERYEIEEEDFTSAELEIVPALKARELGLDASMVGGYGQDDRVSVYTSLMAALEVEKPDRTSIVLFVDKEEIGSTGNTGLQSLMIENLAAELFSLAGITDYLSLRRALERSHGISADVNSAVDPNFPDVFEKMNNSFLGGGVVLTKYTGSRGKADANDANPEYLARLRQLFDSRSIYWQVGELGKVDAGGGGTVAKYMAYYGMDVVDMGCALLSMHSPYEVSSKADIYQAYRAYQAFLQDFA